MGSVHAAVVRVSPSLLRCLARELVPSAPQIDSLVPTYACPAADAVRAAFEAVPAWTAHLRENAPLKARLDAVFGTAGLDAWASWCLYPPILSSLSLSFFDTVHVLSIDDHFFDALTARTCNGHPLPCSSDADASLCVSEADAASVFAIGDFEYECVSPCPLPHQRLTHCAPATGSYIWHAAQNSSTYTSLTFGTLLSFSLFF